uniref:Uncharacterized protein n=1 Tax=Globisporangium ultimum (strain ATCC 200006 / CBS 805.95 / DAOM BR144) TaxID=431595 RepID=K3WDX7_GLOUD
MASSSPKKSAASLEQVNADLTNVLGRLDQVEKKLAAEGKQVDGPVGGVELREYQLQVLARLRQIRDTMNQEGSSLEQLRKERDDARSEAEALKKQVAKLNYRVQHLKQHVQVNVE